MTTITELTPAEQAAQDYKAAMDSVNLINAGNPTVTNPDGTTSTLYTAQDWTDILARNKAHLSIQVAKGAAYYGTNDLTPFENAVKL